MAKLLDPLFNAIDTKLPEPSEWHCYMFGCDPETGEGLVYTPAKGREPNWFARWMMRICFACTWRKE